MQKKAFQQKVIPLANKIYRLAYRFVGNAQEAEDVVQDVFLKLWKIRVQLKEIENMEAYTINLTKKLCIDRLRHEQIKRKHAPFLKGSLTTSEKNDEWDQRETYHEIHNIIAVLPPMQKEIITLRDVEGFSYEEIAAVTGLTINNLRVTLSRIRKSIQETLKKKFEYGLKRNQ